MSGCCRGDDLYIDSSIIYVDGWAANVLLVMRTLESVGGSILMVSLLGSINDRRQPDGIFHLP